MKKGEKAHITSDAVKLNETGESNVGETATQAKAAELAASKVKDDPKQPSNDDSKGSIAKLQALIGIIALTLANVAGFLTHLDQIRQFISKFLGTEWAYHFHTFIVYGASILFLVGYGSLTYWMYWNFFAHRTRLLKAGFYIAAFVAVGTMMVGSYEFLFKPIDFVPLIKKQASRYVQTVLSQQQIKNDQDEGGFRFSQGPMSNDTQAWTTAQCLVALLQQDVATLNNAGIPIRRGFDYIERSRLKETNDGWGYQTGSHWGVTEIDAWVALAYIYSLRGDRASIIWRPNEIPDVLAKINSIFEHLLKRQHEDGSWAPIEKTDNYKHERTYSTIMAIWALAQAEQNGDILKGHESQYRAALTLGAKWLLGSYAKNPEGFSGWWPNPSAKNTAESYPGLEALGLFALSLAQASHSFIGADIRYKEAIEDFIKLGLDGTAKLEPLTRRKIHNNEQAHDSDIYLEGRQEVLEPSTFLWYPWTIALAATLEHDPLLLDYQQERLRKILSGLFERADEEDEFVMHDPVIYPTAEILFAEGYYFSQSGLLDKQK